MPSNIHFDKYLDAGFIDKIKTNFNFKHLVRVEKFIMNFEAFFHIRQAIPDCVVRGGMAVPFHIKDPSFRRLSVDIDMITEQSRDNVIHKIESVKETTKGIMAFGDPHKPKNLDKDLPLLTYFVKYDSKFGGKQDIKVDIFYDYDMSINTMKTNSRYDILGFEIDFPLEIYTIGSLIGDKLTTLGFDTVGIPDSRGIDISRQIYDVATLIRSVDDMSVISDIIDSFKKTSQDEISYSCKSGFDLDVVINDVARFPDKLLVWKNDRFVLDTRWEGRLHTFTSQMLGSRRYKNHDHVQDILLIQLAMLLIKKCIGGTMTKSEIFKELTYTSQRLDEISGMSRKEKADLVEDPMFFSQELSSVERQLKNMPPDQALLYGKIKELSA